MGKRSGRGLRDEMNKTLEGMSWRVLRKIWSYRNPIPPPLQYTGTGTSYGIQLTVWSRFSVQVSLLENRCMEVDYKLINIIWAHLHFQIFLETQFFSCTHMPQKSAITRYYITVVLNSKHAGDSAIHSYLCVLIVCGCKYF